MREHAVASSRRSSYCRMLTHGGSERLSTFSRCSRGRTTRACHSRDASRSAPASGSQASEQACRGRSGLRARSMRTHSGSPFAKKYTPLRLRGNALDRGRVRTRSHGLADGRRFGRGGFPSVEVVQQSREIESQHRESGDPAESRSNPADCRSRQQTGNPAAGRYTSRS